MYSASARDEEGIRRVNLMLSCVRRPCDDGAKIDAWAVQIDSIKFSSRYPHNKQSGTADISYRALGAFFEQAKEGNMTNAVMPAFDATWYFHFGKDFGIGSCNNSRGNPKQNCLDALEEDIVDAVRIARSYTTAARTINGQPIILLYLDAQYATPAEFGTIFNNARSKAGDFYTIGITESSSYFSTFDAVGPWVNLGQWKEAKGSTIYQKALDWVALEHQNLLSDVHLYPGRVVFGGVAPGFDDYTEDWGKCHPRVIPRDPDLLQAEFDFLKSKNVVGVILQTWDDWTEGTHFEPDVVGGTSLLVHARQCLGQLYKEKPDPQGDARLTARWESFGQARNCKGGTHGVGPYIDLSCK